MLLIAILALVTSAASAQDAAHTVTVQVLAINDFHGNVEPPSGTDGAVNGVPAGGAEYLATHLRDAVRSNPNSILVAAGDLMGASPLLSGLFHDAPTVEALNAMNLSVTSIGNHELDHGPDDLLWRIKGGCPHTETCSEEEKLPGAHFQYLAANMRMVNGKSLAPTAVRTVGGVKIGFIGETLEGTNSNLPAQVAKGLQFQEESAVANEAAARLEREGVHAIVLLIHQGAGQHPAKGPVDPNTCVNLQGAIEPVLNKLSKSIRVVISGHTHQFYNCVVDGRTVTSAGSYGRIFTRVNLTIDRDRDTIVKVDARNEVVTRDVEKDPVQTAILERYRPGAGKIANRTVGSVTAEITRQRNEAGEAALGDVVADALLESVSAPDKGGAQVAFINHGGLRANLTGTPGADGRRDISYGDAYAVQPFANQVVVLTMTGDMIRRLLEQQFPVKGNPQLLQVSEGFSYQYRMQAPAGQHVAADSISLGGRPVGAADVVRVATIDFLVAEGGGFTVFREGKQVSTGPVDVEALVAYLGKNSPVAPVIHRRILKSDLATNEHE
jgi:5'-nucleotidase